jgi:hypothetical protein
LILRPAQPLRPTGRPSLRPRRRSGRPGGVPQPVALLAGWVWPPPWGVDGGRSTASHGPDLRRTAPPPGAAVGADHGAPVAAWGLPGAEAPGPGTAGGAEPLSAGVDNPSTVEAQGLVLGVDPLRSLWQRALVLELDLRRPEALLRANWRGSYWEFPPQRAGLEPPRLGLRIRLADPALVRLITESARGPKALALRLGAAASCSCGGGRWPGVVASTPPPAGSWALAAVCSGASAAWSCSCIRANCRWSRPWRCCPAACSSN